MVIAMKSEPMTRLCRDCRIEKPTTEFYKQNHGRGLTRSCKSCTCIRVTANRQANLARMREYDRERGQLEHRKAAVKERAHRYREKHDALVKRSRLENPEKYRARTMLGNAVRDGRIIKPTACECCEREARLHGHHDDYSKPLNVQWLCPPCHGARHRELNDMTRKEAA